MEERIQKILSSRKFCSRRKAEQLILENRVKVNNQTAYLGMKVDEDCDIFVDGKKVENNSVNREYAYIAMNKPLGVICTSKDDRNRKTIVSLIDKKFGRVYPVGRLDINSKGLIFLTDDGDFANLITHPSSSIGKKYFVKCKGKLTDDIVKILENGVLLEDGYTSSAKVEEVKVSQTSSSCFITIHEGKNRQVRRMFEKFGLEVIELKRVQIGFYKLNENLKSGEYEIIDKQTVNELKQLCLDKKSFNKK